MRIRRLTKEEVADMLRSRSITLEEILWLVDGERKGKVLRDAPKPIKGEGRYDLLTNRGHKIYSRLVNIICACSELTGCRDVYRIIEGLDDLTTE